MLETYVIVDVRYHIFWSSDTNISISKIKYAERKVQIYELPYCFDSVWCYVTLRRAIE